MNRAKGGQRATPAFSQSQDQQDAGDKIPQKYLAACETIKAVTGGSEEEIYHVLKSCNYDIEETTNTLLDSPFEKFESKAKKKKNTSEARKAMPKPMPIHDGPPFPRRDGHGRGGHGRGRDDSGRDGRGPSRGYGGPGRGGSYASRDDNYHPRPPQAAAHSDELIWDSQPMSSAPQGDPLPSGDQRPLYNRMSGDNGTGPGLMPAPPPAPAPAPIRPIGVAQPGQRSVADVLKGNSAPSSNMASSLSGPGGFPSSTNPPPPPSASTAADSLQAQEPEQMRTSAPLSNAANFSSLLAPQPPLHKDAGGWNSKPVNSSGRYGPGGSAAEAAELVGAALGDMRVHSPGEPSSAPQPNPPPGQQTSGGLQFGDFGSMGDGFGSGFGDQFGSSSGVEGEGGAGPGEVAVSSGPTGGAGGGEAQGGHHQTAGGAGGAGAGGDHQTQHQGPQHNTHMHSSGLSSGLPGPYGYGMGMQATPYSLMQMPGGGSGSMAAGPLPPHYQQYSDSSQPPQPDDSARLSQLQDGAQAQGGFYSQAGGRASEDTSKGGALLDTQSSTGVVSSSAPSASAPAAAPPAPPAPAGPPHPPQAPPPQMYQGQMLPPGMSPGAYGVNMYPTYPAYLSPHNAAGYHYLHSPYSPYPQQPQQPAYGPQGGSSSYAPGGVGYPGAGGLPGAQGQPGAQQPQVKYASGVPPYKGGDGSGGLGGYAYSQGAGAAGVYSAQGAGSGGYEDLGVTGTAVQGGRGQGGFKDSGLYIPSQQQQQGGASGSLGVGMEGSGSAGGAGGASSYYTPGAYSQQGGYAHQYMGTQQHQYWQNHQMLMQQQASLGQVGGGQSGDQQQNTGYSNKQLL